MPERFHFDTIQISAKTLFEIDCLLLGLHTARERDAMKLARTLVLVASVILFVTALFHGSGYTMIARAMETSGTKPFIVAGVKGLWLAFSFHLIVLAVVVLVVSRDSGAKQVIFLCALIPATDTVLLFHFVGVFVGTVSLAITTILLIAGALLFPDGRQSGSRVR
jgi:hypothetical protein